MPLESLRRYLLVELGWSAATTKITLRRITSMMRRGLPLQQFSRESGAYWLAERLTNGISPDAYNNDAKALNAILRWRHGAEAQTFRLKRRPKSHYKFLEPAQVEILLQYRHHDAEIHRLRRALTLWALKSGMRTSEIAAMNIEDLDPKQSRFYVRQPAKRGPRRWLPIESWIWSERRALKAWLRHRPIPPDDPTALWTTTFSPQANRTTTARRLTGDNVRVAMNRVGQAAGIPLNPTITRHTRATELARAGWGILYIKTYLGHASVKSTEIYAAVTGEDVETMMRRRPGRDFYQ